MNQIDGMSSADMMFLQRVSLELARLEMEPTPENIVTVMDATVKRDGVLYNRFARTTETIHSRGEGWDSVLGDIVYRKLQVQDD